MEEDIKIIEEAIKVLTGNSNSLKMDFEKTAEAIENLLKAYKQDEKMIDLMASYILKNTCVLDWDEYEPKVKEYFRKKIENNENKN